MSTDTKTPAGHLRSSGHGNLAFQAYNRSELPEKLCVQCWWVESRGVLHQPCIRVWNAMVVGGLTHAHATVTHADRRTQDFQENPETLSLFRSRPAGWQSAPNGGFRGEQRGQLSSAVSNAACD
jgi:hypothetical protein